MVKKTKESIEKRRQYVLFALEKYPEYPTRTLARKLHEDDKNLFPTIEKARSAIRYATGTKGKDQVKYARHPRAKKAAGQKLESIVQALLLVTQDSYGWTGRGVVVLLVNTYKWVQVLKVKVS